jgi:hypothetical protein
MPCVQPVRESHAYVEAYVPKLAGLRNRVGVCGLVEIGKRDGSQISKTARDLNCRLEYVGLYIHYCAS